MIDNDGILEFIIGRLQEIINNYPNQDEWSTGFRNGLEASIDTIKQELDSGDMNTRNWKKSLKT